MTDSTTTDYDSPWKEIIESYFPEFMIFFFPNAHAAIDWGRGYTFLDKELQQVVRESEIGRRHADKLVQVYQLDGGEAWVLVHIEVQGQRESNFAERMYVYNYRLFDRYQRQIASLAVLSDDNPTWHPRQFSYELFDCRITLDFPTVKLLDYKERLDELLNNSNPFAIVVAAHLQTQATRRRPQQRFAAKIRLARLLYGRGYDRQAIVELMRFIDWVMTLPTDLDRQFRTELATLEAEANMQYVTTMERLAMEEGKQQGIREDIFHVLQIRFGDVLEDIVEAVNRIEEIQTLRELLGEAVTVDSLHAFTQLLTVD